MSSFTHTATSLRTPPAPAIALALAGLKLLLRPARR